MKQVKVTKTETYKDSQDDHLVCKGKLVLLPNNEKNIKVEDHLSFLKPIIISETEEIKTGDKYLLPNNSTIKTKEVDDEFVGMSEFENSNKILALSENFSSKHLQAIVDGKLRDGDSVNVNCEVIDALIGIDNEIEYKIALSINNHIKLFSIKQRITWDDILINYEKSEYKGFPLINYLKANYLSPERK